MLRGAAALVPLYREFFEYRMVRDAEDRRRAYALRYDVYCEETGYLDKAANPGALERDEHDAHSLHSILIHKKSGFAAGTVRLVLPRPGQPGCAQPARLFAPALDALDEAILPQATTGEISRFSVHPSFRRRMGDGLHARIFEGGDGDMDPRRVIPHITLGLMASIFEMVRTAKLTHLCAIIDPALLRLLARLGIRFTPVGGTVEFHGPRQPVIASGAAMLEHMEAERPEIHAFVTAMDEAA